MHRAKCGIGTYFVEIHQNKKKNLFNSFYLVSMAVCEFQIMILYLIIGWTDEQLHALIANES